jgi:hypothetical protein
MINARMGEKPAGKGPMHIIRKQSPTRDADRQPHQQPGNWSPSFVLVVLKALNDAPKVVCLEMIFPIAHLLSLCEPFSILHYRTSVLFKGLLHTLPRALDFPLRHGALHLWS